MNNRHRQARGTKGIIAKISTELALNDVNLVGIICNSPEDILLVTETDGPRDLEALQRMLGEAARDTNRKPADSKIVVANYNWDQGNSISNSASGSVPGPILIELAATQNQ